MANTSGAGSLADLFKTFGPALFGTGTTTTSNNVDPSALAASRGITAQALANSNDAEGATNDIVNRIIQKNAIAFGPVASGARTAGLYNDSVLKQLSSESQASSTAEASKAVLDFQTQQLGIAQRSNSDQLQSTRTTSSSTAPQVSSSITSLLGLGLGGISAYKNRSDILNFFGVGNKTEGTANAPLTDASTGAIAKDAGSSDALSGSQTQTNAAFGDTSASTTPTVQAGPTELGTNLQTTEDIAPQASVSGDAPVAPAPVEDGGGADAADPLTGSDALTGEATDAAAPTADALAATSDAADGALVDAGTGELATDAGAEIATEAGADTAVELGVDAGADAALEGTVGVGLAPETFGLSLLAVPILSAIFGDSSIICAELKRQGRLSDSLSRRSLMHFRTYKEISREAYYIWAKPSVKHLRAQPNSYYSRCLETVFNHRCRFIAKDRDFYSLAGYLAVSAITVACWPILKVRTAVDNYKMNSYLKQLYRSF